MGFKNMEEFEAYLRNMMLNEQKRTEDLIRKGDAKVRTAMRELQREKKEDIKDVRKSPAVLDGPRGYKVKTIEDEYGVKRTKYVREKTAAEKLNDQLRKEITHCGDLIIHKNGHTVTIPKEFFDQNGKLLPSKREDYEVAILVLEMAAASDKSNE
jgi:exonuclease III